MMAAQTEITKKAIIRECGKHGYASSSISNYYLSSSLLSVLMMILQLF
jgi:hypothetical protein